MCNQYTVEDDVIGWLDYILYNLANILSHNFLKKPYGGYLIII